MSKNMKQNVQGKKTIVSNLLNWKEKKKLFKILENKKSKNYFNTKKLAKLSFIRTGIKIRTLIK